MRNKIQDRFGIQFAGNDNLLLISTGEIAYLLVLGWWMNTVIFNQLPGMILNDFIV